ncbi:MAG: prolyl oligopeptidase family serine peptidase [Bdellovibrionota bacterium]
MNFRLSIVAVFVLASCASNPSAQRGVASKGAPLMNDPYISLEDSTNADTKAFVVRQNERSTKRLETDARYKTFAEQARAIVTAEDRIPMPRVRGKKIRNFWQDKTHKRGILRETTFAEYQKPRPKWDLILDIDALNAAEGKSWVYQGASCLEPDNDVCLIELSDGGRDESVHREFRVSSRTWITDGFNLPAAKSNVTWIDKDTLFVGTDFGPGSTTTSGYPRQARVWKRGTPLADSKIVFEGSNDDVSVYAWRSFRPEAQLMFILQGLNFFEAKVFLFDGTKTTQLPFPTTADFQGDFQGQLIAKLREDWKTPSKTYNAGAVISIPVASVAKSDALSKIEVLWEPDASSAFSEMSRSKSFITISLLRDVKGELRRVSRVGGKWATTKVTLPKDGTIGLVDTNDYDDHVFLTYESFGVPTSLYYTSNAKAQAMKVVKRLPAKYDASGIVVEQFRSTSADGTQIPYFVVHKAGMKLDGSNPTLLYAYGGFESSETPFYSGVIGKLWLENGGVYALANIRGGGEYGPRWHRAALKENRQRAYDDFASVARDLQTRGITSPRRLGIQGGSNGGLLVGVAFTQNPELYRAVVCESALLDMIRYTAMPPGASWIGEYGDPADPKMAAIIAKYSPYQNVRPGAQYPEVFFHISTADDRVQPGHTRKMMARLEEMGHPALMYENTEGGHGGAADLEERVKKISLEHVYLFQKLVD